MLWSCCSSIWAGVEEFHRRRRFVHWYYISQSYISISLLRMEFRVIFWCFTAGVIDEDYRGNVGVVLFNHSDTNFEIKQGDRVAQLICERIYYPTLKEIQVERASILSSFTFTYRVHFLYVITILIFLFLEPQRNETRRWWFRFYWYKLNSSGAFNALP